jgi:hypothetical protein
MTKGVSAAGEAPAPDALCAPLVPFWLPSDSDTIWSVEAACKEDKTRAWWLEWGEKPLDAG